MYYQNFPRFTATGFSSLAPDETPPKVIFVGDPYVGKTTLVSFMKTGRFNDNYLATIGVAFVELHCTINGKDMNLVIWDTAGAEKMNSLTRQHYRGASVAYLCFDLTNPSSFKKTRIWYQAVRKECPEFAILFLVGCKCDLPNRQVQASDIQRFCEEHKIEYWETSAKTAKHVNELVRRTCLLGVALQSERPESCRSVRTVELGPSPSYDAGETKKACC
jgi:Ras-related protein Rab-2A